jgi:hypothetical protein
MQRAGKHRDLLNFAWERPDNIDAFHRHELAELMEADLRLATHKLSADRLVRLRHDRLRLDLIVRTQLLQHRDDVGPAGAARIRDGFRRKQRLLQRISRSDVGARRAGAYRNVDA